MLRAFGGFWPPAPRISAGRVFRFEGSFGIAICFLLLITPRISSAQTQQKALISENYGYINLSQRGGRGGGGGDGDGAPALQQASMTATFSNFTLNGIPFATWSSCRATLSVQECLVQLLGDRNGDGVISDTDLHPGGIGGDLLAFDVTVTNTSAPLPGGGPVLTTFAFQSKFSESPALGSRIGDKLFSAHRVSLESGAAHPLIGVKKNGTSMAFSTARSSSSASIHRMIIRPT